MNQLPRPLKWLGIAGLGISLTALCWPARLQAEPQEQLHCRPGCQLRFAVSGVPWWVEARLGVQPLAVQRTWNELVVSIPEQVPEGTYPLELRLGGLRTRGGSLTAVIDRTAPELKLRQPVEQLALASEHCMLVGRSEPGADIRVAGQAPVRVDSTGSFRLSVPLRAGWNRLEIQASDKAGNVRKLQRRVFSDRESPRYSLERLSPDLQSSTPLRSMDCDRSSFRVRVLAQDDGGIERIRYRLDGHKWQTVPLKAEKDSFTGVFALRDLFEGTRMLELEVVDRAGRRLEERVEFLVDSSEQLGDKVLTLGARGKDVEQLQQRLAEAGVLEKSSVHGHFDATTEEAVRKFQQLEGMAATGQVRQAMLVALGPRIFVNLGRFELVFDRPGEKPRRFSIACGAPEFPTPTGKFRVADLAKDPTWIPPDSPWAREAKTMPPGPDNPLGTRWIGLDWGGVGIHGTNADWSIGSASSHGCMRMHLDDVEQLYEWVQIGTPVTVYGGWEEDRLRLRFWP